MRLEIFILGLTAFFVYNAYHDGKYWKQIMSYKKYYTMENLVIGISGNVSTEKSNVLKIISK